MNQVLTQSLVDALTKGYVIHCDDVSKRED